MKRILISAAAVAAFTAAPAIAQQNGLVNVDVTHVLNSLNLLNNSLNNNTVQVPIDVAANVCGIAANVLAQKAASGPVSCSATSSSSALRSAALAQATRSGGTSGGGTTGTGGGAVQNGLVNVDVSNVLNGLHILNGSLNNNTVQVPVSVAANVCGIAADVLAQKNSNGGASCTARSMSSALRQAILAQAGGSASGNNDRNENETEGSRSGNQSAQGDHGHHGHHRGHHGHHDND